MQYLTERDIEGESTCIYFLLNNKISPEWWGNLLSKIEDEDLHENGKEYEPHVTVYYSPERNKELKIKEIFKFFRSCLNITISFESFEIFQNEDYDVLFLKAKRTTLLEKIKIRTLNLFGMKDLHPEYIPHMTVAYLKSGEGEYYRRLLSNFILSEPIEVDSMVYSVSGFEKNYKLIYKIN